jgi:membrane associated rhomboid family serine protease
MTRSIPFILLAVVVICASIEAALLLADFGVLPYPYLRTAFLVYGGFWTGLLHGSTPNYASQPYVMFASYAFLHGGVVHLVVNMFTLVSLGRGICMQVGSRGFAAIYAASVVGGAVGFALLAQSFAPMVGASGGIFGLVGAILAWNYRDLSAAGESLWPVVRVLIGLVLLNLVLWWATGGLLAWQTHLGGFVAGWLIGLLITPHHDDVMDE